MVVQDLNRFLRGWAAYFRFGNSTEQFKALDRYVFWRLARFLTREHDLRGYRRGMADLVESRTKLGLYCLTGGRPLRRCARRAVNDVGEPCEGKPHARFEAAAGGNAP